MKIISKFHDYYDGINPSQEPIWIRKNGLIPLSNSSDSSYFSKEIIEWLITVYYSLKKPKINYYPKVRKFYNPYPFDQNFICICGKIYPFYEYKGKVFIDRQKIVDYYHSIVKKGDECSIWDTKWIGSRFVKCVSYKEWKQFINQEKLLQVHLMTKSPIFLIVKEHNNLFIEVNPCFKTYNLHKCFNAWSLYQDIEQYLTNELVQCKNPPVELDDVSKRDKHGMDKWSFKKVGKNSKV